MESGTQTGPEAKPKPSLVKSALSVGARAAVTRLVFALVGGVISVGIGLLAVWEFSVLPLGNRYDAVEDSTKSLSVQIGALTKETAGLRPEVVLIGEQTSRTADLLLELRAQNAKMEKALATLAAQNVRLLERVSDLEAALEDTHKRAEQPGGLVQ